VTLTELIADNLQLFICLKCTFPHLISTMQQKRPTFYSINFTNSPSQLILCNRTFLLYIFFTV